MCAARKEAANNVCSTVLSLPKRPQISVSFNNDISNSEEFGRYWDWLRGPRPRGWSSSPGRIKNVRFSMSFRTAIGSTQLPVQPTLGALSRGCISVFILPMSVGLHAPLSRPRLGLGATQDLRNCARRCGSHGVLLFLTK
jgi:hypothetical protein